MSVQQFRRALRELQHAISSAESLQADLSETRGVLQDFRQRQKFAASQSILNALKLVKSSVLKVTDDDAVVPLLVKAVDALDEADLSVLKSRLDGVASLAAELVEDENEEIILSVPKEIQEHVDADLQEVDACFRAGLFRSAVILCGRILEAALHRKYFDATGVDLLEKAPGTGLGNLIAKLAEKGVSTDPGLTNQIHLINQVRIHSVHQKKEAFMPSKEQTKAIILYTTDVLNKLFA